jgi:hypothetical protein
MLLERSRPLSCWKVIAGVLIILLFLPVGACGVFCTVVGVGEMSSPNATGATEVLAVGFGLLVVAGLFIYLGWKVLTNR